MLINKSKVYLVAVNFCITVFVLFPTGEFFGFPVKKIALLISLPIIAYQICFQTKNLDNYIGYYFLSCAVLFAWVVVGVLNAGEYAHSLQEYSFTVVYMIVFLMLLPIVNVRSGMASFYRCLLTISFIYSLIKLVVSILIYLAFFDIGMFLAFYKVAFGVPLSTLAIPPTGLWRINNANDILIFIMFMHVFLYWREFPYSFVFKVLWVLVVFSAIYISFSRLGFLIISLSFIGYTIRYKTAYIYSSLFLFLIFITFLIQTEITSGLQERFTGDATAESNSIKTTQVDLILGELSENIFLGSGWGVPMKSYVRSEFSPYSYESQFPSFLYKLGLVGFSIFISGLISLALYNYSMWKKNLIDANDFIIKNMLFSLFIFACCVNLYYSGVVPAVTLAFIILSNPIYLRQRDFNFSL